MARWTFFGRVLPERLPLRIDPSITGHHEGGLGVCFDFTIGIADGQIAATINSTGENQEVHTVRNAVENTIRNLTDVVGYLNGLSYDVEIISAACLDDGRQCIFGPAIPVLAARHRSSGNQLSSELLQAIASDPAAQMALAHFREAMRIPVDTGFFCYRAIEAIMQSMKADESENEKTTWPRMHNALRIGPNPLFILKGHADLPRHGKSSAISDADRAKVFKIADEIIGRYLQFLIRGRTPLPEQEFPLFDNEEPLPAN